VLLTAQTQPGDGNIGRCGPASEESFSVGPHLAGEAGKLKVLERTGRYSLSRARAPKQKSTPPPGRGKAGGEAEVVHRPQNQNCE